MLEDCVQTRVSAGTHRASRRTVAAHRAYRNSGLALQWTISELSSVPPDGNGSYSTYRQDTRLAYRNC